jgi:hypothetical protein
MVLVKKLIALTLIASLLAFVGVGCSGPGTTPPKSGTGSGSTTP